jgi:hypothetical protein
MCAVIANAFVCHVGSAAMDVGVDIDRFELSPAIVVVPAVLVIYNRVSGPPVLSTAVAPKDDGYAFPVMAVAFGNDAVVDVIYIVVDPPGIAALC